MQINDAMVEAGVEAAKDAMSAMEAVTKETYDEKLNNTIRAALQAALAGHVDDWRDIASAPKDGTPIDVITGGAFPRRVTDVQWRESSESEWWVHGGDTIETPDATWCDDFGPLSRDEQPTHWMPIPAAPAQREG